MTDLDRVQLKRDCSDALDGLLRDQRMDGLAELAERSGSSGRRTDSLAS